MTVRELIEKLKQEDPEALVVYRDDGDYYEASDVYSCTVDKAKNGRVCRRLQDDPPGPDTIQAVQVV